jgi:DNA-binding NarL/FixJ family response regulator
MRAVIADDSMIMRARLRQYLRAGGVTIAGEADNALAALALCLEEKPDLAVLDVLMPPGSGKDVALELVGKVPHILVVSSNSQNAVFAPLRAAGVHLLTKPLSDGQFAAKLAELNRGNDQ